VPIFPAQKLTFPGVVYQVIAASQSMEEQPLFGQYAPEKVQFIKSTILSHVKIDITSNHT